MEAIQVDDAVEEAVINDPREHVIMEAARPQKIPTMLEDGIEKVIQGRTSLSELSRVVDLYDARGETPEVAESDDEFYKHVV